MWEAGLNYTSLVASEAVLEVTQAARKAPRRHLVPGNRTDCFVVLEVMQATRNHLQPDCWA